MDNEKKMGTTMTLKNKIFVILGIAILPFSTNLSSSEVGYFTIARVKYSGGGDWYTDPSAIPNLLKQLRKRTNIATQTQQRVITLLDDKIYEVPFLFITGHGNINFTHREAENLRNYLLSGGFLHADDDYGMDEAFRREIKKVFPDRELREIPFSHPIYNSFYDFSKSGPPKIHHHREGPPKGYGIFDDYGRLIVYYTYNTNISDGYVDIYDNPPEVREKAFKMGINIIVYVLNN